MPYLTARVPKYRLHKASGQAVVTIRGRDIYLGAYASEESRCRYDQTIAEFLAHGRHHPAAESDRWQTRRNRGVVSHDPVRHVPDDGLTVDELFLRYWDEHVVTYYRKHGEPTTEQDNIRKALRWLLDLYGRTPAAVFGPLALKTYRHRLIDLGRCRTAINRDMGRVKRLFKWAGENEIISPSVHHHLQCVAGLRRGRSTARESEPIKPVEPTLLEPVMKQASAPVAAMIRVQLYTGMRAGEVVLMRTCDIEKDGKIWRYSPARHKTEHHGKRRVVFLGPKAQAIIEPYLNEERLEAYLFRPKDAVTDLNRRRREGGGSPTRNPTTRRTRRGRRRKEPGDRYSTAAYGRAIIYACNAAFPPPECLARRRVPANGRKRTRWETVDAWRARLGEKKWRELLEWRRSHRWSPNQLRHNAATDLRKQFGIEAARVVLGHASAAVTEVYAELDFEKASQIMGQVG